MAKSTLVTISFVPQEFSHESAPEFRDIEIEELREVLDELHRELQPDLAADRSRITLEEIAEATDMPLQKVEEAVQRVREARMAAVLRELEEPLYRVERPGTPPADPFMTQRFSRDTFSSLLDRHAEPETPPRNQNGAKKTFHENVTDHLATLVAVLVVISVILFLILTIVRVR